jgi:uncharacterized membrane protein YkoI
MDKKQRSVPRLAATGAVIAGLAAGSYGIANAASGGGTTTGTTTTPSQTAPSQREPRGDETALTGDALTKVTAAAKAKVPDGTIDRVETDADGNAAYEAHMTKADGTHVTVYVDASFNVVSVETGGPGGHDGRGRHGGPGGPDGGPRGDETELTGDALTKVTAAAKAKVPGATVDRVETDADGNAAYEAHMTKADGTHVTVYVDKSFDVVSVETR